MGQTADADIDPSRGVDVPFNEVDLPELRKRAEAEAEGEPYSVAEVKHTVGTRPEPDYEPTPDVAVDGSIKREGGTRTVSDHTAETDGNPGLLWIVVAVVLVITILILLLFVI